MNLTELLQGIADAIRTKTKSTDKINAQDFPAAISNIEGGGVDTLPQGLKYKVATGVTTMSLPKNLPKATSCTYMFEDCTSLTSLDLSNFDTSEVKYTYYMFHNCTGLTNLDISKLNTSKVTDMQDMFKNCSGLTNLDVSNWDTSKVISMQHMFNNCKSLTSLDLSAWDTSSLIDVQYMFYNCTSLTSLDISSFDFTKITTYYLYMLSNVKNCTIYVKDDVAKTFITDKVQPDSTCTVVIKGA